MIFLLAIAERIGLIKAIRYITVAIIALQPTAEYAPKMTANSGLPIRITAIDICVDDDVFQSTVIGKGPVSQALNRFIYGNFFDFDAIECTLRDYFYVRKI